MEDKGTNTETVYESEKFLSLTDRFMGDEMCLMGSDKHPCRVFKNIYSHFVSFCKEEGDYPVSKNVFSENLKSAGFVSKRIGKQKISIKMGFKNEFLWEDVKHYYIDEE